MDVREKLVELLGRCAVEESITIEPVAESRLVDFLVNHGVTVQEWISVEDRLPEDSANVLVCHKNGLVTTNAWLGANWWFKNERNPITHWMPLPLAPEDMK